jgi:hypothetical protein
MLSLRALFAGGVLLAACDRPPAPVAPTGPSPAPEAKDEIDLGSAQLLDAMVTYRARGTSVVVRHRGASMAHASSADGQDNHFILVPLEIWADGQHTTLSLVGAAPARWKGYRFAATEEGFTWGKTAARITVSRDEK